MDTSISTLEAARRLGCSETLVRKLADAGKLPCERTVLGRIFRVEDVDRLAAERRARRARREHAAA